MLGVVPSPKSFRRQLRLRLQNPGGGTRGWRRPTPSYSWVSAGSQTRPFRSRGGRASIVRRRAQTQKHDYNFRSAKGLAPILVHKP